jgi:hypothetical protein
LAHTFFVPPRTHLITLTLSGNVRNATPQITLNTEGGKLFEDVSAKFTKTIATAGSSEDKPLGFHLRRAEDGYHLELRGRNGAPTTATRTPLCAAPKTAWFSSAR